MRQCSLVKHQLSFSGEGEVKVKSKLFLTNQHWIRSRISTYSLAIFICLLHLTPSLLAQTRFQGIVYMDENHNLKKDDGEEGIKDVLVSSGKDIVKTDRKGYWKLSAKSAESIFCH